MGLDIPRPDAHGLSSPMGSARVFQKKVADIGSNRTLGSSSTLGSKHVLTHIVVEPKSALALLSKKASGAFFMLQYQGLSASGAHVFKGHGVTVTARGDLHAVHGQMFSAQLSGRGAQGAHSLLVTGNANSAWLFQQASVSFSDALYRFFSLSSKEHTQAAYKSKILFPSKRQAARSVLHAASESKGLSLSDDIFEDLLGIMLNENPDEGSFKGDTGNKDTQGQDTDTAEEIVQAAEKNIEEQDTGPLELNTLISLFIDAQSLSESTAAALDEFNDATDTQGRRWQLFPIKLQENGIALKGHLRLLLEGKGFGFSESMQRMALELKSEKRIWHFYASSAFSGNLILHAYVSPWPEEDLHQLESRLIRVFSAVPISVRMTSGEPPFSFIDCLEDSPVIVDERA